jgi:hypothetical protein
MRAAARLGWRIAAVVAFGATAALAVTLTRGAPLHAALTSSRLTTGAARNREAGAAPRCATSGLRISIGPGTSAAGQAGRASTGITGDLTVTRYPLDFTNVSGATCALGGYPVVAAYAADGAQLGNAASADTSTAAHRVVLAPGATARAAVTASIPTAATGGCRPVVATGLRVAPPGQSAARDVRDGLLACSAAGHRAPVFLWVGAVAPVTPPAGTSATSDARTAHPAGVPHQRTRLRPRGARGRHSGAASPSPSPPALASGPLTGWPAG